jgi:hypothetical protein
MAARSTLTVTSGTTITSSWGNAVRDHALPFTTSNDVTSEGQLAVNTSTDRLVVYNGSAAVELARYGDWSSWTPTLSQGGSVTNSAGDCVFTRSGRLIVVTGYVGSTGTGTASNAIIVGTNLPLPAATGVVGFAEFFNSGDQYYIASVAMNASTGNLTFASHGGNNLFGINPNVQLSSGDGFNLVLSYRAASAA